MKPTLPAVLLLLIASVCPVVRAAEEEAPRIKLERLFKLEKPVGVARDPGNRVFFVEQVGRLRQFVDGKISDKPYLDMTKKVYVEYECGLLGVAFHPKFAENGFLYVNYTAKAGGLKTFISEFRADPKAETVDLATERVILTIDQPFPNHNGGQIEFGPDGMLYIGMGDGGSAHDPNDNAQNPKSLLGKMLRIDVSPREKYGIPADNPFVGKGGYAPEIWALGLRNPWRFCFDRATGLLYAADVGQDVWEEVNLIEKGGNYGWRIREGKDDLHPVKDPPKTIDPVFQYNHDKHAASITGGYVYRGKKIPGLVGWYLFADYSHGKCWGIKVENGKLTKDAVLIDPKDPNRNGGVNPTQPSSFGEDADGELFLLDANGPVYRIVPGN